MFATQQIQEPPDPLLMLAERYLPILEDAQRAMLLTRAVPTEVEQLVDELSDRLDAVAAPFAREAIDPYLGQSLFSALLAGEKGLRTPNEDDRRRRVRLALERVRQILRDIADESASSESADVRELLQWLVDTVSVAQGDVARLLGVSPRQLQRWLSPSGPTPRGDDEARLRVVAKVVAHLRHVYTGPGAVRWFTREHPALSNGRPIDLLDDALEAPRLVRLAARSRSTIAT